MTDRVDKLFHSCASARLTLALRVELHHAFGSFLFGPQLFYIHASLPCPRPFVRGRIRAGGLALIRFCLRLPGHNALYPDPNSRKTRRESRHKISGQYGWRRKSGLVKSMISDSSKIILLPAFRWRTSLGDTHRDT